MSIYSIPLATPSKSQLAQINLFGTFRPASTQRTVTFQDLCTWVHSEWSKTYKDKEECPLVCPAKFVPLLTPQEYEEHQKLVFSQNILKKLCYTRAYAFCKENKLSREETKDSVKAFASAYQTDLAPSYLGEEGKILKNLKVPIDIEISNATSKVKSPDNAWMYCDPQLLYDKKIVFKTKYSVDHLSTVWIDFDQVGINEYDLHTLYKKENLSHIIYSSFSNSSSKTKFRLIVPISRPVTTGEYDSIIDYTFSHFDNLPDKSCKDWGRGFYVGRSIGTELDAGTGVIPSFFYSHIGQKSLNVDDILKLHPAKSRHYKVSRALTPNETLHIAEQTVKIKKWLVSHKHICNDFLNSNPGFSDSFYTECPWRGTHTSGHQGQTDTFISLSTGSGRRVFRCNHSHCQDKKWQDVLDFYPDYTSFFSNLPEKSESFVMDDILPIQEVMPGSLLHTYRSIDESFGSDDHVLIPRSATGQGKTYAIAMQIVSSLASGELTLIVVGNKREQDQLLGYVKGFYKDEKIWGEEKKKLIVLKSGVVQEDLDRYTVIITHTTYLKHKGHTSQLYKLGVFILANKFEWVLIDEWNKVFRELRVLMPIRYRLRTETLINGDRVFKVHTKAPCSVEGNPYACDICPLSSFHKKNLTKYHTLELQPPTFVNRDLWLLNQRHLISLGEKNDIGYVPTENRTEFFLDIMKTTSNETKEILHESVLHRIDKWDIPQKKEIGDFIDIATDDLDFGAWDTKDWVTVLDRSIEPHLLRIDNYEKEKFYRNAARKLWPHFRKNITTDLSFLTKLKENYILKACTDIDIKLGRILDTDNPDDLSSYTEDRHESKIKELTKNEFARQWRDHINRSTDKKKQHMLTPPYHPCDTTFVSYYDTYVLQHLIENTRKVRLLSADTDLKLVGMVRKYFDKDVKCITIINEDRPPIIDKMFAIFTTENFDQVTNKKTKDNFQEIVQKNSYHEIDPETNDKLLVNTALTFLPFANDILALEQDPRAWVREGISWEHNEGGTPKYNHTDRLSAGSSHLVSYMKSNSSRGMNWGEKNIITIPYNGCTLPVYGWDYSFDESSHSLRNHTYTTQVLQAFGRVLRKPMFEKSNKLLDRGEETRIAIIHRCYLDEKDKDGNPYKRNISKKIAEFLSTENRYQIKTMTPIYLELGPTKEGFYGSLSRLESRIIEILAHISKHGEIDTLPEIKDPEDLYSFSRYEEAKGKYPKLSQNQFTDGKKIRAFEKKIIKIYANWDELKPVKDNHKNLDRDIKEYFELIDFKEYTMDLPEKFKDSCLQWVKGQFCKNNHGFSFEGEDKNADACDWDDSADWGFEEEEV